MGTVPCQADSQVVPKPSSQHAVLLSLDRLDAVSQWVDNHCVRHIFTVHVLVAFWNHSADENSVGDCTL